VIIREIEVRAIGRARRHAAISVAGAALLSRLVGIWRRPIWFDELFTLWISRQPPARVLHALRIDSGPPLFYFLDAPFVRLGEIVSIDATARLLPFAAVAAIFVAASRPETSAGLRFVVLIATAPLLFFYSGEARAYGPMAALGFLLFLSIFRFRSRGLALGGAVLAAGLLPWTHYLGVIVVAGSILLCLVRRRQRLALAQLAAVLPFAAWLPVALRQPAAGISWSDERWLRSLSGALGALASWPRIPPYFSQLDLPRPWAGAILGAAITLASIVVARKRSDVRDALLFAGIPLGLAAAAGVFQPVYFTGRTEMMTLPVALWAFARAARTSAVVAWLAAAAATIGMILIASALLMPPAMPPYALTAAGISGKARIGDLVVASDADYLPLRLAADRGALQAPLVGIPSPIERHPGWFEPGELAAPETETARLSAAMERAGSHGRTFFAVPPDPAPRALVLGLLRGGRARIVSFPGADPVLVLDR
jgi:hypothetical protein